MGKKRNEEHHPLTPACGGQVSDEDVFMSPLVRGIKGEVTLI